MSLNSSRSGNLVVPVHHAGNFLAVHVDVSDAARGKKAAVHRRQFYHHCAWHGGSNAYWPTAGVSALGGATESIQERHAETTHTLGLDDVLALVDGTRRLVLSTGAGVAARPVVTVFVI